jgi:glycosyltransferase involved in cell wall biosynthesis
MRILLVSNMYPSPERPEYGVFVARVADALQERGHDVRRVGLQAGARGPLATPWAYAELTRQARAAVAEHRPDVVYAHFLVPTGLVAIATGVPYVITAHGTDVRNMRRSVVVAALTKRVLRRAAAVICVSEYVAKMLSAPEGVRVEVIDCGVDTRQLRPVPRAPGAASSGPRFLFIGSLTRRKNLERLLQAFAKLGGGTLTIVGGGPLEAELRATAPVGTRFAGRLSEAGVAEEIGKADVVCLPSLEEPQGQAMLEALACGRPVVATRVGGPAEVLNPRCGALVDPLDVESIAAGMVAAAALPVPCAEAVRVAAEHALPLQAERIEAVLTRAAATAPSTPTTTPAPTGDSPPKGAVADR